MHGNKKFICIAGKNQCSIDFLKYTSSKISKKNILVLPNKNDKGISGWQPSLKNMQKNKFKIVKLSQIYKIKNLIFISIEYENILDISKFIQMNYLIFISVYYPNIEDVILIFIKFT